MKSSWMKDLRKLAKRYEAEMADTPGGHVKLTLPNGRFVFAPQTGSDSRRGMHNVEAMLRRTLRETGAAA